MPKVGAAIVTSNRTTLGFMSEIPLRLPVTQMATLGISTVALLAIAVFLAGPMIGVIAVLGLILGILIVRTPLASILAFIVINVVITLRPNQAMSGGAPSMLDLFLGLCLGAVIGYWMLRLRIIDDQPLSASTGQLCLMFFFMWGVLVTIIGFLTDGNNAMGPAVREILNLSPLLILPVLYERFVEPDTNAERAIFLAVFTSGIIMLAWNILRVKNSLVQVVYLFQTGRGNSDESLSGFMVLLALSIFVSVRRLSWKSVLVGILLLVASVGVVISFSRMLYIATAVAAILLLILSKRHERNQGMRRLAGTGLLGILAFIPFYYASHLVRLLVSHYVLRLLTSQHVTSDLSLMARYTEWAHEWQTIIHSPILGYGFGAFFRTFDIILGHHSWIAFSHSSYLYIVFKTGFVGAFLFFSAWAIFLRKGYLLLQSESLSPLARVVVRACVAFLVLFLIGAYSGPLLNSKTDLIWVGLMWGYFLALEKKLKRGQDPSLPKSARIAKVATA